MIIHLHTAYRRSYKHRITHDIRRTNQINQRIQLFLDNPNHPLLQIHQLKGTKRGLWSFSATGDIRIIFEWENDNTVIFHTIGTHNQVY